MSTPAQYSKESDAFVLPAVLDISAAEKLLEKFRELNTDTKIILDASKVQRITTPCIQIILSAHKTIKNKNGSLEIKNASDACKDAFYDIGLADEFNGWGG